MKDKITLKLDKRELQGRKVKQLRRQGIVPANIFGKKSGSIAVQVSEKDFVKVFDQAGETSIIYATVEGETASRPVLVSAAQIHPVFGSFLHIDFHQVDLTQKVTATVPVVLEGESPAVTEKGAVLVQAMNELDVEALPADLPHEINVDITSLKEIGDTVTIKDIKIDSSKVEIKAEPDEIVAQAQEPQKEEEPVATEASAEAESTPAPEAAKSEEKSE